jgi:hypothetical protein
MFRGVTVLTVLTCFRGTMCRIYRGERSVGATRLARVLMEQTDGREASVAMPAPIVAGGRGLGGDRVLGGKPQQTQGRRQSFSIESSRAPHVGR